MTIFKTALAATALVGAFSAVSATAAPYVMATANCTLNSDGWCLGGGNLASYRTAITTPSNFGPGGISSADISINQLAAVNASTLAGANAFVSTWWNDTQSASSVTAIVNFFLSGGDLFLLQDDTNHDAIGAALGLAAIGSNGSASNGVSPLFTGAFGTATDVTQAGNFSYLDAAAVSGKNGSIGGVNAAGQITSAYWAAGQYAAGAGKLVILGDVDMISSFGTATYSPLNSNGKFALNTTAFLTNQSAVPEPATWGMMILGFGMIGAASRSRKVKTTVAHA